MTETRSGAASAVSVDSKRKRSPRYPVLAIDEAVTKVRAIYNADRRAFATFDSILEHMGYKVKEKKGGRSARIVATLKQYGLLEDKAGKYRVSDMAFRILELPEDSPERAQLIKQAALSPAVISKVLKHYQGVIPSDTTLRSHLILEEEFNPDSAEEFIKVLRRTISVVHPESGDYNSESSEELDTPSVGGTPRMQPSVSQIRNAQPPPPLPKPESGQRPFPLYLSKNSEAVLLVPAVMSRTEYELLKKQLENSLLVMEATSVIDSDTSNESKD